MAVLKPEQEQIRAMVEAEALRQGVDPDLATSLAHRESGFNPRATSPAGAQGVMQLMPGTATRFKVADPYDPQDNIRGGVAYLKHLGELFPDNPAFQVAAYHAGEGAVQKARGIPKTSDGLSTTAAYAAGVTAGAAKNRATLDAEMTAAFARARQGQDDDLSQEYLTAQHAALDAEMTAAFARAREEGARLAAAQGQPFQGHTPPPLVDPIDATLTAGEPPLVDPTQRATQQAAARPSSALASDPTRGITFVEPQPGALQAGPIDLHRGRPQPPAPFQGSVTFSEGALPALQPPANPQALAPGARTIPPFGSQGIPRGEAVEESGPGRYAADIAQGAIGMVKSALQFIPAVEQSLGLHGRTLTVSLGTERLVLPLERLEQALQPQLGDSGPGFLDRLAQGIGTSLASLVPAASVGRFLSGLASVAPGTARVGAALSSGVLEGAAEAGNLYEQLAPIVGQEEAAQRAMTSFGLNAALVSATDKIGIFGEQANRLRHTLTSVVTNGLQEGVQYEIERQQLTVPVPALPAQEALLLQQGWVREGDQLVRPFVVADAAEAVLIGSVVGGLGAQVAYAVESQPGPAQEAVKADAQAVAEERPQEVIVNPEGLPLRVYRGDPQPLEGGKPDPERIATEGAYGPAPGGYWSISPDIATEYAFLGRMRGLAVGEQAPTVTPAYLAIQHPLDMDAPADPAFAAALGLPPLGDNKDLYAQGVAQSQQNIEDAQRQLREQFPTPKDFREAISAQPESLDSIVPPILLEAIAAEQALPLSPREATDLYRTLLQQSSGMPAREAIRKRIEQAGFDGITHQEPSLATREMVQTYIVFSPEQVIPAFGIDAALQAQAGAITIEPARQARWQQLLDALLPPASASSGRFLGNQRGGIRRRPGPAVDLPQLSDAEIDAAAQAELEAAAHLKEVNLAKAREDLAAVQRGDTDTIMRVLKARNAIVAEDGGVVYGTGASLRRFDTPQDAATAILTARIPRLEADDPYQAMRAVKRALETQRQQAQAALPAGPGVTTTSVGTGRAAELVSQATPADLLPYQSLQQSGAAAALPRTGKTAHVNFDMVQTSDDVKQVIAAVADLYRSEAETQRRGVQSTEETTNAAAQSSYHDLDTILGLQPGTALNAEDAYAVRQAWVSAAAQLHQRASEAAQSADPAVHEAFLKQFVLTAHIHVAATGVRGEAGRALRVFGIEMPATERHFLANLQQVLSQANGISPQDLATRIAALPTKEQLARFLVQSERATRADIFTELWYGGLLSNPTTHVVNAIDGAMRAIWAIPERYVAAGIDGDIEFQEANAYLYGFWQGVQSAWRYAAQAFKTETSTFGESGKVEAIRQHAIRNRYEALEGTLLGSALSLLDTAASFTGRALLTVDEWFKAVNFTAELHAQAYRQARVVEGLDGLELAQRMAALIENPGYQVKEAAIRYANIQTLAQPLDEAGAPFEGLGQVANLASQAREHWLPAKLILPFVRTPFNVVREGLVRTPAALLSSNVRATLNAGGAEANLLEAKINLGSLVLFSFGMLAYQGILTGKDPYDPALRDAWQRLGLQPYSVRLGDTFYSYNRFDLFGLPMGLMADFAQLAREGSVRSLTSTAGGILAAIFNNLTSKTYLRGLADIFEAITPEGGESDRQGALQLERYLRRQVGSVIPSGVAAVARMLDPVQRETRSVMDVLLSRLPGFSQGVPPRLDLWARERINAEPFGPDLLSPILSRQYLPDEVDLELLRLRVPITMPERVIRLDHPDRTESEPVELTPQQYARYVELSAGLGLGDSSDPGMRSTLDLAGATRQRGFPALHDLIRQFMQTPGYEELGEGPQGGKSMQIRRFIQQYRQAARAQLMAEFPELAEIMQVQQLQKTLNMTREGQEALRNLRVGVGR